jgi:hypothetical protein
LFKTTLTLALSLREGGLRSLSPRERVGVRVIKISTFVRKAIC